MVESLEDYKKILSNKLDNILQENKELIEAFIYDNAQENADYILLKNRLIHLFFEEMPIYYFEKLEYILNFINSITDTRHYYTHYNKSKKYKAMKGVELSISTIILQTLLESCIFKELGFTNDFINNHKRESFSRLKKYEIPKREEKYIKLYKKVHLITSIENILKIVINEYNIGDYTSYHVTEDNADEDLYVEIITKTNKKYRIRILSENKNDEECEEIIKNDGAVISEYENNIKADSNKFLERNRIVAGLGIGTLVVEAGHRSGTSVTARFSRQNNKPVFCVPSSLENIKGKLTNEFIQKGAKLVRNAEDIIKEMNKVNPRIKKKKKEIKTKNLYFDIPLELLNVYKEITDIPKDLNQIARKTKLSISEVNYKTMMLQLEDKIIELPGQRFVRNNNEY